ncbi:hypothetical protein FACS1894216_12320 [Synergistales bacterium]|nr:hypothetical protein FACS1894216_12320 [Synergistales bacterium]
MVLEMAGSRIVAPYMGTSLVVWTSLIGIIMASLTLGYYMGGRLSDAHPSASYLSRIIAVAAAVTAVVALLSYTLLEALSSGVGNIYVSSVIASVCLFAPPSALLGMVSPFIVRLAIHNLGEAGETVGRFSALSSAGSILGTFLGGFVLVAHFSSQTILFMIAAVLAAVAFILRRTKIGAASAALIFTVSLVLGVSSEAGVLRARTSNQFRQIAGVETQYNSIKIMEAGYDASGTGAYRGIRILKMSPFAWQSIMYLDNPTELFSRYTQYVDLALRYYKPDAESALILGGAGYCIPKYLTASYPSLSVDVVEIDSGMTKVAREYFSLRDTPKQRIFHEDARVFLNREARDGSLKYDLVFDDAFSSADTLPFHLTTVECVKRVHDIMSPGGVFITNVIAPLDSKLLGGLYGAVAASFPNAMLYAIDNPENRQEVQNLLIIAVKSDTIPDAPPKDERVAEMLSHRVTKAYEPSVPPFTDALAPVELYNIR